MSRVEIFNGRLLLPNGRLQPGGLRLTAGKIERLLPAAGDGSGERRLDAQGGIISPGLIDLQCNGGFGLDFTQQPESIAQVAEQLPRFGVTSFLPTLITAPLDRYAAAQAAVAQAPAGGSRPLGLHIEGPFISPVKKGAHPEEYIQLPDRSGLGSWRPEGGVRLVTLAPELPGALAVVGQLVEQGVVVSAGHSLATFEESLAGFDAGIRYVTHLFNAMPPLHHREPGLVGAALADRRVTIGLIPDGIHVHPQLIATLWRAAPGRINLVTDSMAALGCGPGEYKLGAQTVIVRQDEARLADGTLAGSKVTLDAGVRNLMAWSAVSVGAVLTSVTRLPADLLGLPHLGRLTVGSVGDVVVFDRQLRVTHTVVGGQVVYRRQESEGRGV